MKPVIDKVVRWRRGRRLATHPGPPCHGKVVVTP